MPFLIPDACRSSDVGSSTEVSGEAIEMLRKSAVSREMLPEAGQKKARAQL